MTNKAGRVASNRGSQAIAGVKVPEDPLNDSSLLGNDDQLETRLFVLNELRAKEEARHAKGAAAGAAGHVAAPLGAN